MIECVGEEALQKQCALHRDTRSTIREKSEAGTATERNSTETDDGENKVYSHSFIGDSTPMHRGTSAQVAKTCHTDCDTRKRSLPCAGLSEHLPPRASRHRALSIDLIERAQNELTPGRRNVRAHTTDKPPAETLIGLLHCKPAATHRRTF